MTQAFDPTTIPVGTRVRSIDGSSLGAVREALPFYLLVDQDHIFEDLTVPSHAIVGLVDGEVIVSVNQKSASEVDPEDRTDHDELEG